MKELKSIQEVSILLGCTQRQLRHYESVLGLEIGRNESNHRHYTPEDIRIFQTAIQLADEGLSLKGIRVQLEKEGYVDPEMTSIVVDHNSLAMKSFIVNELREVLGSDLKDHLNDSIKEIMDIQNLMIDELEKRHLQEMKDLQKELQVSYQNSLKDAISGLEGKFDSLASKKTKGIFGNIFGNRSN